MCSTGTAEIGKRTQLAAAVAIQLWTSWLPSSQPGPPSTVLPAAGSDFERPFSGRAQRSNMEVCPGFHVCIQAPHQLECVLRSMSEVLAEDPAAWSDKRLEPPLQHALWPVAGKKKGLCVAAESYGAGSCAGPRADMPALWSLMPC